MSKNTNGQDQNPDHRATSANVEPDYQITPTPERKPYRKGHLSAPAMQVVLGLYPIKRLSTDATTAVSGAGGVHACHAVLAYIAGHWGADVGYAWVADETIAIDLRMSPGTVSKCKKVLKQRGLMTDVGKDRKGIRRYAFHWFDEPDLFDEPVSPPTPEPSVQPVSPPTLKSTDIQEQDQELVKNRNSNKRLNARQTHIEPIWCQFIDDLLSLINHNQRNIVDDLEYVSAFSPFEQCLANGWKPDQLAKATVDRVRSWQTESGSIVQILKDLQTVTPPKPKRERAKCGVHECDGLVHVDPETLNPYRCPKLEPAF